MIYLRAQSQTYQSISAQQMQPNSQLPLISVSSRQLITSILSLQMSKR